MIVKAIEIELSIHQSGSLKDKRRVVKGIIDRIRSRYNASIAETGALDNHSIAVIGISCVSNSARHADEMLDHILHFIDSGYDAEITHIERLF